MEDAGITHPRISTPGAGQFGVLHVVRVSLIGD